MDVVKLLAGYRRATAQDHAAKHFSVGSAYQRYRTIDADCDWGSFLDRIPAPLLGSVLGPPSIDAHYTEIFAILAQSDNDIDPLWAATLNLIVLSLNFQTRIFENQGAEAFIFSGAPSLAQIALLGSNAVNGVYLETLPDEETLARKWPQLPDFALRPQSIVSSCTSDLPGALGNRMVGGVALDLTYFDRATPAIRNWLAPIGHRLSRHTIYALSGAPETIADVADALQSAAPEATIFSRTYGVAGPTASARRAILIAKGIQGAPQAFLEERRRVGYRFAAPEVLADEGALTMVDYRKDAEGRPTEWIKPKRPSMICSNTPLPAEAQSRIADFACYEHQVVIIRDGVLIPHFSPDRASLTFLPGTSRNQIVDGSYGDLRENYRRSSIYRDGVTFGGDRLGTIETQPEIRIDGPAMPLFFTPMLHMWHSHFMMQCLPRIRILEDLGIDAKLIIPFDLRRKQREMLALLGYGADRIVEIPRSCIVRANTLIVPKPWPLVFSPYTIDVYDRIIQALKIRPSEKRTRILISREERTAWRNFLNYPSIRQMLVDDYQFEVVRPEKLTLHEEVSLFHSATMLAGAEGAGMYGAAFSSSDMHCVVIGDEDYVMPTLGTLAELRGFEVSYVVGDSVRADSDLERRLSHGHADFIVDPQLVRRAVADCL